MNLRSLSVVCFMFLMASCSQSPVFREYKTVSKIGDQPEWAAVDMNDEDWMKEKPKIEDGRVFWYRTPIDILKAPDPSRPYGIRPFLYGEYEAFWDGVLIGKNGNPGQEAMLPPEGSMRATHRIPVHLSDTGQHMLAIRVSLHYFPDHVGLFRVMIKEYDDLLTEGLIKTSYMHLFAGAFLIASFYFLFLFLSDKKEYPMLVFSVSCFLFFVLNLVEFITSYVPIHYSQHHIRLEFIGTLMLGISYLIPLYFAMQFPFARKKIFFIIYAVILVFIFFIKHEFIDLKIYFMAFAMWVFSLGIVVVGVYKKMKGSLIVLIILILSIALRAFMQFEISLFTGFSLILLSMLYLLSLRVKEQRLAYESSLVQSTRLRLELLKKNIQPHFLMNTLTSLIDWVEQAPKKGVLFIEALAKEFDLINQMENQTLISIDQEIALCRSHLEIMEYRKEINYSWEDEGIDSEQRIPPAIFHTLLENGITHSLPLENNSVQFKLEYESNDAHRSYTFSTFTGGVRAGSNSETEGTGLKYVKARLSESYDSNWDLTSEPTDQGWKTVIKIYS